MRTIKYPRVQIDPAGMAGVDLINAVCKGLETEYSKAAADNFKKIATTRLSAPSLRVLVSRTVRTNV